MPTFKLAKGYTKPAVVLMALLRFLSIFTGFPYTVKLDPPTTTLRKPLLVYSVVMALALGFGYSSLVIFELHSNKVRYSTTRYVAALVGMSFMLGCFMIILVYNLARSSNLRNMVNTAAHLHMSLRESFADGLDWNSIIWVTVTGIIVVYLLSWGDITETRWEKVLVQLTTVVATPMISLTPIMYSAFIRLCASCLTATFKHIEDSIPTNPMDFLVKRKPDSLPSTRIHEMASNSEKCISSELTIGKLESARRHLYAMDQLVRDVNKHYGPVICAVLGNELVLGVNTLHGAIANIASMADISLSFFFIGCLRIYLILNAPESYTKKVLKESVLCRLIFR